MHRKYFIYVHERDCYDLYLFSEKVQALCNYFIIQFENLMEVPPFLSRIPDNNYPAFIIIDLRNTTQVPTLISELQQIDFMPTLPVLVLWEAEKPGMSHKNTRLYERPQNNEGWEHLANYVVQFCQVPSR